MLPKTAVAPSAFGIPFVQLPADQLPSDVEGAQRVVWQIRLKATVEFGADLNDEYPIHVVATASRTELPQRKAV